jgi:hypothetical protein
MEYFYNCEVYDRDYEKARTLREELINDKPILPATRKLLVSVVKRIANKDTNKWFTKPVHKIWPDLPPAYYDVIKRPVDLDTIKVRVNSGHYLNYKQFLEDVYLVFDNALLYNSGAPQGSEGALVAEAADALIWYVVEPWADATIDIEALLEVADLNAIIAARTAGVVAAREAEEERVAQLLQDAAQQQTAGSLVAQLNALWSDCDDAGSTSDPAALPIEALLLNTRGPPTVSHSALHGLASEVPRRQLAAAEKLQLALQFSLDELARDAESGVHSSLAARLRATALQEGRALCSALAQLPGVAKAGLEVHEPLPSLAGNKRPFSDIH